MGNKHPHHPADFQPGARNHVHHLQGGGSRRDREAAELDLNKDLHETAHNDEPEQGESVFGREMGGYDEFSGADNAGGQDEAGTNVAE